MLLRERNFHLISHAQRDARFQRVRGEQVVDSRTEHTRQQFRPEYLVILAFLKWTHETRAEDSNEKERERESRRERDSSPASRE